MLIPGNKDSYRGDHIFYEYEDLLQLFTLQDHKPWKYGRQLAQSLAEVDIDPGIRR